MTVSISSLLASTLATGAQNHNQLTLNAVNNTLTTRLNNRIAQLQSQAADTTTVELLQSQLSAATTQNTAFSQASSQYLANGTFLADLTNQLTALNTAASTGDSSGFDSALALAQTDLADLNVVAYVPGTQPDGVTNLKLNGLGIQSSATYNLSTPAGQAQAEADVANARSIVSKISTITTQNQEIAASSSAGLTADINNLNLQLNQITQNQNTTVQAEITKLQQQEQDQFHVLELTLSTSNNSASLLTGAASNLATVLASQSGSITASKTNRFMSALASNATITNQLTSTRLSGAATQPSSTTTQENSVAQAAAGSLVNIFG